MHLRVEAVRRDVGDRVASRRGRGRLLLLVDLALTCLGRLGRTPSSRLYGVESASRPTRPIGLSALGHVTHWGFLARAGRELERELELGLELLQHQRQYDHD